MMKKWISGLVILFFAIVMIFQKDTPNNELQFVRNSSETSLHNAANQQRDYLFQDWSWQATYEWQLYTGNITGITTSTLDNLINPNEVNQIISTLGTQTGQTYTWNIYSWTITTGNQISQKTGDNSIAPVNCITPWNEEVKNNDFVLAYEQRKDVNTICNIEKRVCTNGILWGSFTQSSCKEDVVYTYQKAQVISYNQKVLNDYIQPTAPINAWAEFNNQGKIDTTGKAIDTQGTSNTPVITTSWITQNSLPSTSSCITPRGQEIKHGQFIKAYKAPRGFIDLACNVEIRACVNGNLKGTFTYSKCTFNNTSYSDYLKAGSPTTSTGFFFFQRIKAAFRRW